MKRSAILGYRLGVVLGLALMVILFVPAQQSWLTRGPANIGHESLGCQDCHQPAPGSIRQQLQANVRYWLGQRTTPVDFGHQSVTNSACFTCHDNPKDRHPVDRFTEPRFAEVRALIHPEQCVSCHREHQGVRVTNVEPTYCQHCHQEITLANDPLDVPHSKLIADQNWSSCLTCHDYHSNHDMQLPTRLAAAPDPAQIVRYFQGGPSPYPGKTFYPAKKKEGSQP